VQHVAKCSLPDNRKLFLAPNFFSNIFDLMLSLVRLLILGDC